MAGRQIIRDSAVEATAGIATGHRLTFGLHSHVEIECNFVRSGNARCLVAGRRYDLTPGVMAWIIPGQEHTLLDCSGDFAMWVVLFRPKLLDGVDAKIDERLLLRDPQATDGLCRMLSHETAADIDSRLSEIERQGDADPDLSNAALRYLLLLAWRVFRQTAADGSGATVHPAVDRAVGILRRNPCDLDHLARQVGLTPSHLSRLFHTQTGVTITDFRNQSRLERFFTSYGDGQRRTALQAALDAGFGSYAQCHRVCLESTGRTPRRAALERRGGGPRSG